MPSITRRKLVAGGAAATVGGYGGYRLIQGAPDAGFESWAPEQGTWPLERYDTANTAHNPHASPPRETPEQQEIASVTHDGTEPAHFSPLAGSDRPAMFGSRLAVYGDGTATYGDAASPSAGFGSDGRLHAVRGYDSDTDLVGYEGGDEVYRHSVSRNTEGLIVGRKEVYVGTTNDGVFAYEPGGGRDWKVGGETAALDDDHLYTAGGSDGTAAYRERTSTGRWVSAGPKRAWTSPSVQGDSHPPAVADGRLTVGMFSTRGGGGLAAFDAETGEALWEPKSFGDDSAADVSTPAVAGRNGYVAAGVDDLNAGFVARYDLETGEEVWRDDTDWYASDPTLAGDTLVVAGDVRTGSEAPATTVRAYDTGSGDELWTVTFPGDGGTSLALVGKRVLATAGSSLYELA